MHHNDGQVTFTNGIKEAPRTRKSRRKKRAGNPQETYKPAAKGDVPPHRLRQPSPFVATAKRDFHFLSFESPFSRNASPGAYRRRHRRVNRRQQVCLSLSFALPDDGPRPVKGPREKRKQKLQRNQFTPLTSLLFLSPTPKIRPSRASRHDDLKQETLSDGLNNVRERFVKEREKANSTRAVAITIFLNSLFFLSTSTSSSLFLLSLSLSPRSSTSCASSRMATRAARSSPRRRPRRHVLLYLQQQQQQEAGPFRSSAGRRPRPRRRRGCRRRHPRPRSRPLLLQQLRLPRPPLLPPGGGSTSAGEEREEARARRGRQRQQGPLLLPPPLQLFCPTTSRRARTRCLPCSRSSPGEGPG